MTDDIDGSALVLDIQQPREVFVSNTQRAVDAEQVRLASGSAEQPRVDHPERHILLEREVCRAIDGAARTGAQHRIEAIPVVQDRTHLRKPGLWHPRLASTRADKCSAARSWPFNNRLPALSPAQACSSR